MLGLAVRRHRPGHQLIFTVQVPYSLLISYPVEWALLSQPRSVHDIRLSAFHAKWLEIHTVRLVDICTQSGPVEEACKDVQGLLEPGRPLGG